MRCVTHPTHDSVFGDTYHGVPNPLVPHRHPYPTRYHGPIFQMPQASFPYVERPYAVSPYAGVGEYKPPLLQSLTGVGVVDIVIGAGFGYMVSPTKDKRLLWTAVGAAATGLAGTLGLIGTAAGAFMSKS